MLSGLLFSIGVYGVLARRNAVTVLMSVELMLNAANLNFVAFDAFLRDRLHSGQVFALFVVVIAAAEVGVGLAIVLQLFRLRDTVAHRRSRHPRRPRPRAEPGDDVTDWAWLIPFLPFAAAAVGFLGGRRLPGGPAATAIAGTLGALVVAVAQLPAAMADPGRVHEVGTAWFPTGGIAMHVGTRVDGLAAVVAVMVCVVALLVQIYSPAYMEGDRRYWAYAAEVSLFTAAMLLVVVASDLFELYVGWEVMGVCSYLLIGHYWWTPTARAAAVKAFVTTRIGDVCLLIGVFVLGLGVGSFGIGDVVQGVGGARHAVVAGRRAARCSAGSWASPRSSRCTSGCPTRWPARPRSAP